MKKISLNTCLLSCTLLISSFGFSQNIKFNYDACGNRVAKIMVSKETKTTIADSLLPNVIKDEPKLVLPDFTIAISPNPTNNFIQVHFDGLNNDMDADAFLFTAKAELISSFQLKANEQTIDLSNFTPGVYFLKVRVGGKVESWKIIKQ